MNICQNRIYIFETEILYYGKLTENLFPMAGMLKYAAAQTVNKGHPSTFYRDEKENPVTQALDQEVKQFFNFIKKKNQPGYRRAKDESSSRA